MLESETITASALRYKLHRLPTQVKDEIQGETTAFVGVYIVNHVGRVV